MTTFERTDSDNSDFRYLVALLDADLAIRDGDDHAFYSQFNKVDSIRNVVVCYLDGKPIGCGAFKNYEDGVAEIKRMFVLPELRGHGIGLKILNEIELWAAENEYTKCILETGTKQPEAIRLYKKAGYNLMENYGQYAGVINSVCMEKLIDK